MRLFYLLINIVFSTLIFSVQAAENFDLSDFKGKVVYLDFWASWCGPCRESFPFMNQIHQKYADKGLVVISINVDAEKSDANKFLAKVPADFAIYFDPKGKTAESYKVKGMPNAFLFDRTGKLIMKHIGFRKDDPLKIEKHIVDVLAAN